MRWSMEHGNPYVLVSWSIFKNTIWFQDTSNAQIFIPF